MTSTTEAARERAQAIADMVPVIARERVALMHPDEWTEQQSFEDFRYTVGSMEAFVDDSDGVLTVLARPRMRPHGDYWTNVPSEILDTAADRVDSAAGDTFTFDHGTIEQDAGSYEARLVMPPRLACGECGAPPELDCKVYNCQGSWS